MHGLRTEFYIRIVSGVLSKCYVGWALEVRDSATHYSMSQP